MHHLVMTFHRVTVTRAICIAPVIAIAGATTTTRSTVTICHMAWFTLMVTSRNSNTFTTTCETNSRSNDQHYSCKSNCIHLLHNPCTVSCRAQLLIVIIDCLFVYVNLVLHVTIHYYFFTFCSASSARRMYDLAFDRALSALRLLSSALSIAFRALRKELLACSYCF